jgi:hypothetical protein
VQSRPFIPLMAGLLVVGRLAVSSAQQPTVAPPLSDSAARATQDTGVRGYAPAPAAAPAPAPAAAPAPARATLGATLGFVDVLPNRSAERIRAELADTKADKREAEVELSQAEQQREHTKAMLQVKKQEISTIDARRKLAEKTKDEGEKVALGAEKKDAERQRQFLERRSALYASEVDRAKAAIKVAEATQRALDIELQLNQRRAGRAGSDASATARQDLVIRELEAKVLEAQRNQADAEKQLADKDVDIARRRLELHRAQAAVGGS